MTCQYNYQKRIAQAIRMYAIVKTADVHVRRHVETVLTALRREAVIASLLGDDANAIGALIDYALNEDRNGVKANLRVIAARHTRTAYDVLNHCQRHELAELLEVPCIIDGEDFAPFFQRIDACEAVTMALIRKKMTFEFDEEGNEWPL